MGLLQRAGCALCSAVHTREPCGQSQCGLLRVAFINIIPAWQQTIQLSTRYAIGKIEIKLAIQFVTVCRRPRPISSVGNTVSTKVNKVHFYALIALSHPTGDWAPCNPHPSSLAHHSQPSTRREIGNMGIYHIWQCGVMWGLRTTGWMSRDCGYRTSQANRIRSTPQPTNPNPTPARLGFRIIPLTPILHQLHHPSNPNPASALPSLRS